MVEPGLVQASIKRKLKNECYRYLEKHQDEILPLSHRGLPYSDLAHLGAMESNVGKKIANRMKTRGCSWSNESVPAMIAILSHLRELSAHAFIFTPVPTAISNCSKVSHRSKNGNLCSSVQHACFPIVKTGKLSQPFYQLFKNIMDPELSVS